MQNKGLVRVFAILFALVSLYQLSFTYFSWKTEEEAKVFAEQKVPNDAAERLDKVAEEEVRFLDSIQNDTILNLGIAKFTYNEVKQLELNKGLDLKGGINVILQISVKDVLKGLANDTKDPLFNQALAKADQMQKSSNEPYIELFFTAFDQLKGESKLASPDIFATITNDDIEVTMTDDEVRPIIRGKVNDAIVSAFEVLRNRIDKFGVTQPNIQRLGSSGRILVELPGARDIQRVSRLLQQTAQLEFWETFKSDQLAYYLIAVDNMLYEKEQAKATIEGDDEKKDSLATTSAIAQDQESEPKDKIEELLGGLEKNDSLPEDQVNRPLFDLIMGGIPGSPVLATVSVKDKDKVLGYLNAPESRRLLQEEHRYAKFLVGKQAENSDQLEIYAIQADRDGVAPLTGEVVVEASQGYDNNVRPDVNLSMNTRGARIWEELTGKVFNDQGNIAIVLDDIVYSAPGVSKGAISGGNTQITGNFTLNEAIDLANVLRAGRLPAQAEIIQSEIVGPSLGQEAIDSGINSFMIALLLVLIWMIIYYGVAGIFADIALLLNLLLIFGVLAGLGAVLTLPGIAGIVLTIGMSVDANVIIFERIKEELDKGKGQRQAIADGFQNALSSILDANITTGLTALILFIFGTGPIKGFATTLLIGIATSLFTAIFITRLSIDWYINRDKKLTFSTGLTKNFFKNINIDFLSKRKWAYIFSGALILIGIISLVTQGLNQGVDFVGGRSYVVRFEQAVNPSELSSSLVDYFVTEDGLKVPPEVKTFGNDNQVKITTKYKVDLEETAVDEEIQGKLFEGLKKFLPDGMSQKDFVVNNENKQVGILQSIKVGPTIADDIKQKAVAAIFGSLLVVFLYILLRFRRWQFSAGAVIAVFHDVLIVLGIFSLTHKFMPFNMEIDQAFIAAILTVIGYSLNDTVIVFDRIREYAAEHTSWPYFRMVNAALSSTLSRTLNTSLTTLVVLLAIFAFGGESIRGFMFALIVGIVVGTYSSLFIATPVLYDTMEAKDKRIAEPKKK